jgi:hypothetical protein
MDNIRFNSSLKKINNVTSWLTEDKDLDIPKHGSFCGQAPYLMYVPSYIERFHSNFPNSKVVVCLRDPSSRAYSHYNHLLRKKAINKGVFCDLILDELKNKLNEKKESGPLRRYHIVQRGFYHNQLINLFKFYDRKDVCIVIQEKMLKNTEKEVSRVCNFLNIDRIADTKPSAQRVSGYKKMDIEAKEMLANIYKTHNEKLFNLLGFRVLEWEV